MYLATSEWTIWGFGREYQGNAEISNGEFSVGYT